MVDANRSWRLHVPEKLYEPAVTSPIESAIQELLADAGPGRSVSSEAVARTAAGEDWRRALAQVRAEAVGLARQGRLVILRHNKPVDPNGFKGVYRLRLPDAED